MFFYFHKYGKVQEDGFQYCQKTGKARKPSEGKCQHKWEQKSQHKVSHNGHVTSIIFLMRCKNCGDYKNHTIDAV